MYSLVCLFVMLSCKGNITYDGHLRAGWSEYSKKRIINGQNLFNFESSLKKIYSVWLPSHELNLRIIGFVLLLVFDVLQRKYNVIRRSNKDPLVFRSMSYVAIVFVILIFRNNSVSEFICFQF